MTKHIRIIISLCLFSSLETSIAEQIKNVLLVVSDDLKASSLGCYGNKICKTPNLDRLAANGMVFERAYCQGTWCAPSRLSFMHSRYQGGDGENMGSYFRSQGMHSARVKKINHMRVPGISLREPMAKTSHLLGTKNLIQKGRKLTPQATTPASIKTSSPINRKTANQLGWRTGCLFQLITTAMVPISLIGRLQKRPSSF